LVPVTAVATALAAECPFLHLEMPLDRPAKMAGPGRWEPAVADHELAARPANLVGELAREGAPSDIAQSPRQTTVVEEVGGFKVLDNQLAVGLDKMAGDLVKERPPNVGDTDVLAGKPSDCLGTVGGASLLA